MELDSFSKLKEHGFMRNYLFMFLHEYNKYFNGYDYNVQSALTKFDEEFAKSRINQVACESAFNELRFLLKSGRYYSQEFLKDRENQKQLKNLVGEYVDTDVDDYVNQFMDPDSNSKFHNKLDNFKKFMKKRSKNNKNKKQNKPEKNENVLNKFNYSRAI